MGGFLLLSFYDIVIASKPITNPTRNLHPFCSFRTLKILDSIIRAYTPYTVSQYSPRAGYYIISLYSTNIYPYPYSNLQGKRRHLKYLLEFIFIRKFFKESKDLATIFTTILTNCYFKLLMYLFRL